eukprot:2623633-Amphidinium_carterae.1
MPPWNHRQRCGLLLSTLGRFVGRRLVVEMRGRIICLTRRLEAAIDRACDNWIEKHNFHRQGQWNIEF